MKELEKDDGDSEEVNEKDAEMKESYDVEVEKVENKQVDRK